MTAASLGAPATHLYRDPCRAWRFRASHAAGRVEASDDGPRRPRRASLASEAARIMGREQAAMNAARRRPHPERSPEAARPRGRPAGRRRDPRRRRRIGPGRRAAPARLDFAALDAMPPATGDAQWQCLAAAIYFESRGEPLAGQIAVAEVVLNRVDVAQLPRNDLRRHHPGRRQRPRLPVLLCLRRPRRT